MISVSGIAISHLWSEHSTAVADKLIVEKEGKEIKIAQETQRLNW